MLSGLSGSGKGKALEILLKPKKECTASNSDVASGFLHRQIVASGFKQSKKQYFEEKDRKSSLLACFQSGFLRNTMELFAAGQVEAFHHSFADEGNVPEMFNDPHLRDELGVIYKHLKSHLEQTDNASNFEKFLPHGIAVVNIWKLSVNRVIVQFLQAFSGVFKNSHMWLFADLEDDINSLHKLPTPDGMSTKWRTRLHYLLRSCKLSQINGEECDEHRKNICTIFARHSMPEFLEKMKESCKSAAKQLGVSQLLSDQIVTLNLDDEEGAWEKLREQLRQLMKNQLIEVPLSWIFLRSSLQNHNKVYMKKGELKDRAEKCNITDDDFHHFCDTFTSFGSILDVSCIDRNSKYIIVKPVDFLTLLDKCLPPEYVNEKNGIVTEAQLPKFSLSIESNVFLEILTSAGLATSIPCSHVIQAQQATTDSIDTFCYYMPSLTTTAPIRDWNIHAIQLVSSITAPSVAMETAFTREIRKLCPDSMLVLEKTSNCTNIKVAGTIIKIIYFGDVIEFLLEGGCRAERKEACVLVVMAARAIAEKRTQRPGKVQYHFAVTCVTDEYHSQSLPFNIPHKRHILPRNLCDECNSRKDSEDEEKYQIFLENIAIWQEVLEVCNNTV